MTALVLSVVILALSCATAAAQSQSCGEQGGGMLCPRNLCSSKSGYCGLGGDYCGQGCQSGACSPLGAAASKPAAQPCPATSAAATMGTAALVLSTAAGTARPEPAAEPG
ncbi:hypothetical protein SETIT_2G243400v2 [Setaria italica]|uniref:Chitin-binding type-1 domain-containing protein n=1 Tax=Setaria italica TaxID=4555 RepID=K4A313_SETIT|nr:agglutinin isolectin 2 [Setaria italica]RCV12116.1 hypothetical protein SETIT_2G243400v2 [Setaria italica]